MNAHNNIHIDIDKIPIDVLDNFCRAILSGTAEMAEQEQEDEPEIKVAV